MDIVFRDRSDAGQQLAKVLLRYKNDKPVIVGLARGGVDIGAVVAKTLDAKLEVMIVRKLGAPFNPEYGIGAITESNGIILDPAAIQSVQATAEQIESVIDKEKKEIVRRIKAYRDNRSLHSLRGKTVILVDDGVATGVTAQAAIQSISKLQPHKLVFAVPVCSSDIVPKIESLVDDFVYLYKPPMLQAISQYYEEFNQVTDEDVVRLLKTPI